MTEEKIREYTLRVTQANASGLVLIIYELAFDAMNEAKTAMEANNQEAYKSFVNKAEKYVQELIHGLNHDNEMADMISREYLQAQRELIHARITLDDNLISNAENILKGLLPTFQRIAGEDTDTPLMENTQKVYAGLTYGRTSLNEMAVDPRANRGYTV